MYSFLNDYSEGAHERILLALERVNREQDLPYGTDIHCKRARSFIQSALKNGDCAVHFLIGGTQCNLAIIAAALRPYQGVIAAESGHINTHETGAIEATGHKVLALSTDDGRLTAEAVETCILAHYADENAEHTVQPGMVYISNPTELGTVYTRTDLAAIHAVCRRHGIPLYVDGARLGCALAAEAGRLSWQDLAQNAEAFSIGGTKMGALLGEALVITDPALARDFRYTMKQRGAMMAKGRLLGIQFEELLRDGLYLELAEHAVREAQRLAAGFREAGYGFFVDSPTNQIFPILPRELAARLAEKFRFSFWQRMDETHDAFRFCCSWATPPEQVDALLETLKRTSC